MKLDAPRRIETNRESTKKECNQSLSIVPPSIYAEHAMLKPPLAYCLLKGTCIYSFLADKTEHTHKLTARGAYGWSGIINRNLTAPEKAKPRGLQGISDRCQ